MKKLRKLTESEYFQIQEQYDKTPAPADSFGATGEHGILTLMLRKMGYEVPNERYGCLKVASKLLDMGYVHVDTSGY